MNLEHMTGTTRPFWFQHYFATLWRRFFGINISPVTPLLAVGGQFRPEQWPAIHRLGIRAVLSLQAEYEDQFLGTPPERTLRLLVIDHDAPSLEQLAQGVTFIAEAHRDHLPVLVHCHAGVGRAPTTAAAYMVAKQQMERVTALHMLRAARPIISLNAVQQRRLREWDNKIRKTSV